MLTSKRSPWARISWSERTSRKSANFPRATGPIISDTSHSIIACQRLDFRPRAPSRVRGTGVSRRRREEGSRGRSCMHECGATDFPRHNLMLRAITLGCCVCCCCVRLALPVGCGVTDCALWKSYWVWRFVLLKEKVRCTCSVKFDLNKIMK